MLPSLLVVPLCLAVQQPPLATAGRWLLDAALASPIYKLVLVPQAKSTMVKTAEANGVPWRDALDWIQQQGPWKLEAEDEVAVPEYYRQPFHAYEEGNLSWEAAWEGEIASRAVGARNFPDFGANGEDAFRGAFDEALAEIGASAPTGATIVDLGCGSGISTRRLASNFPNAANVIGLDLSPHFVAVGNRLLEMAREKAAPAAGWRWVQPMQPCTDTRISLARADAAHTGLDDGCADVVSLSLVIHELPPEATLEIVEEAHRLLKPGGQIWITEMDFETPAFAKLRANPVLFSLIRATEPYLDVYADFQPQLPQELSARGFSPVRLAAATGRHFALVATKASDDADGHLGQIDDRRQETAKVDTHLKTWEAKSEQQ